MNIPHKLEKLRDELAKACDDKYGYHGTEEFFVLGWNACFQALSEAAGAFDKQAAIEQAKHEDSDGYFGFLTGAEWQFEQDRAKLGLQTHNLNWLNNEYKQLEARLAEVQK